MSSKTTTSTESKYINATYKTAYMNPLFWYDQANDESATVERRVYTASKIIEKSFDRVGDKSPSNIAAAIELLGELLPRFEKSATKDTVAAATASSSQTAALKAKLTEAESREAALLARIAALEAKANGTTPATPKKRRTVS
jgi:hypothetical protein